MREARASLIRIEINRLVPPVSIMRDLVIDIEEEDQRGSHGRVLRKDSESQVPYNRIKIHHFSEERTVERMIAVIIHLRRHLRGPTELGDTSELLTTCISHDQFLLLTGVISRIRL